MIQDVSHCHCVWYKTLVIVTVCDTRCYFEIVSWEQPFITRILFLLKISTFRWNVQFFRLKKLLNIMKYSLKSYESKYRLSYNADDKQRHWLFILLSRLFSNIGLYINRLRLLRNVRYITIWYIRTINNYIYQGVRPGVTHNWIICRIHRNKHLHLNILCEVSHKILKRKCLWFC